MLLKGIYIILRANLISLVFSLATNFLLPKYLLVEAYAAIKTFQLYSTYAVALHLGYSDGMYLKYGGVVTAKVDRKAIASDIKTMRAFQILITIVVCLVAAFFKNFVFLCFAISIFPLNMTTYYKQMSTATGEFKRYGKIMNLTTVLTFVVNISLLLLFEVRVSGRPYVLAYVALNIAIWLILEMSFYRILGISYRDGKIDFCILRGNIQDGFLLMLGNFSATLLASMARLFVKAFLDTVAFAQYSFSASVENLLVVMVAPISIALYNFFCKNNEMDAYNRINRLVMLFAPTLPACYFPIKWFLTNFLERYESAHTIILYLFAAQVYSSIVKCVFVNVYKSQHLQQRYFARLVLTISVTFGINLIGYMIMPVKEVFAVVTFLSAMLWLVLCFLDFPQLRPSAGECSYLLLTTAAFLGIGYYTAPITGCILYILSVGICAAIFMRHPIMEGVLLLKTMISSKKT